MAVQVGLGLLVRVGVLIPIAMKNVASAVTLIVTLVVTAVGGPLLSRRMLGCGKEELLLRQWLLLLPHHALELILGRILNRHLHPTIADHERIRVLSERRHQCRSCTCRIVWARRKQAQRLQEHPTMVCSVLFGGRLKQSRERQPILHIAADTRSHHTTNRWKPLEEFPKCCPSAARRWQR